MPTVLITGANRGIGREFVKQYDADGWRVIATCRDPSSSDISGECHALDIDDPASIDGLASALSGETIDVLINNAGVYGPRSYGVDAIPYDDWETVMRVNALAPLRVSMALLEPVARSDRKLLVFLSSTMGSIGNNTSGGSYIYRSSKAALNAAVTSLAIDLQPRGVGCLLFHPGWVRTDMGGPSAAIDTVTSVRGMRQEIEAWTPDRTGAFIDYSGATLPW